MFCRSLPRTAAPLALPALAVLAFAAPAARALPLFSRAGGPACSQCHLDSPQLSPAGIRFMQSGYRDSQATGMLSAHSLPISVTARLGLRGERIEAPDAAGPHATPRGTFDGGVELQSAGAITRRLSFHFDLDGNRAGDGPRATRADLQIADLISRQRLNARIGSFDAELPFLSEQRCPTLHPYLAPVGLWARGLELNGGPEDWRYGAGLIHSNQSVTPEAEEGSVHSFEDTYWMLMHQAGRANFGARMLFDRQDSTLPSLTWMQHLQLLVGGAMLEPHWSLAPAYVFDRFDDRPAAGIHDRHQYYVLAGTFVPGAGRWAVSARAEHEYRTRTVWTPEEDHQLLVLNVARVLNPLARVAIEGSVSGDNVGGPRSNRLGAYLGLQY